MHKSNYRKSLLLGTIVVSSLLLWSTAAATTSKYLYGYNLASAERFVFDPKRLHWKAIDASGKVVRSGEGSGGRHYCRDSGRYCRTPVGRFHVSYKGGAGCKSSRYPVGKGGSPMPYCMYFSKNYAVHGSYHVPDYNASHGCIRIHPKDAKWLYYNFMKVGTTVIVKSY